MCADKPMMEERVIRRQHSRLRLGIDARFLGFDGLQSVVLHDLSKTGAKVLLEEARPVSQGVLSWMDFEVFGEVAWRRGRWCGIEFDEQVSEACLVRTRADAPALPAEARERLLNQAEEFVAGETAAEQGS